MTIRWYEICDELTTWLNWSIISSTSSKMKSMTKTSNSKNLKFWLASKICDDVELWLTEMKTRMPNSNRSQKFLFWTNWTFCWICDEADFWLISWQSFEKIFLFVCETSSFQIFFFLFRQSMIFLLYRDVRAEYILREHWNDVSECIKKMLLIWRKKRLLEKFSNQELKFDILMFWIIDDFDDSVLIDLI